METLFMCVCLKDKKYNKLTFSLQWHITAKCDQHCRHCYMYDSDSYMPEMENELSLFDCKLIVDDFIYALKKWSKKGSIVFTGGDPLLRKDFFDLLIYTSSKDIYPIGIAGNSYNLSTEIAKALKKYGVSMYQISLDGMREIHDSLRKPGSFEDALRGYEVLKEAGINPMCMFTLSRYNMHELIDVIRLATELDLAGFDFDRLVPIGNGTDFLEEMISPDEYRELLLEVNSEYKKLRKKGCNTLFGYKDNLWALILKEEELISSHSVIPEGFELKRGCLIGLAGLAILADGSVMACRRLPLIVGKLPEQKITEVFESSPKLNELRKIDKIKKCSSCSNIDNCRGCRAIAYSCSNGDYFFKDPGCWL